MNPATRIHLTALLDQLDTLKGIHRSGESPAPGQVEVLFDQADNVRNSLQAAEHADRPAAWSTASQVELAARRLVELVAASIPGGAR